MPVAPLTRMRGARPFLELLQRYVEARLQAGAGRAVRRNGVARHDDDVGGRQFVVQARQHQRCGGQQENTNSA